MEETDVSKFSESRQRQLNHHTIFREIVKVANRFKDRTTMKHSLQKWKASQRSLTVRKF